LIFKGDRKRKTRKGRRRKMKIVLKSGEIREDICAIVEEFVISLTGYEHNVIVTYNDGKEEIIASTVIKKMGFEDGQNGMRREKISETELEELNKNF
jgi:hypothetical protein